MAQRFYCYFQSRIKTNESTLSFIVLRRGLHIDHTHTPLATMTELTILTLVVVVVCFFFVLFFSVQKTIEHTAQAPKMSCLYAQLFKVNQRMHTSYGWTRAQTVDKIVLKVEQNEIKIRKISLNMRPKVIVVFISRWRFELLQTSLAYRL